MINFYYQIPYRIPQSKKIKNWLSNAVLHLNKDLGNIDYIFCDNKYITNINIKHLQHYYPTDILTFDYVKNNTLSAEIYISIEQVKENAKTYKTTIKNELHRVLIHGILHLAGYKDQTKEQKHQMHAAEDFYLSLRPF